MSAGNADASTTGPRHARLEALDQRSPALADLYRAALLLMDSPDAPARVRLVAHCVREIGNRLPQAMGSDQIGRWKCESAIAALRDAWSEAGLPEGSEAGERAEYPSAEGESSLSVPPSVTVAVQHAIMGLTQGQANQRQNFMALYRDLDQRRAPLETYGTPAAEWVRTLRWFMRFTHENLDGGHTPDEPELQAAFRRFEDLLGGILAPFYTTTTELEAILERANA